MKKLLIYILLCICKIMYAQNHFPEGSGIATVDGSSTYDGEMEFTNGAELIMNTSSQIRFPGTNNYISGSDLYIGAKIFRTPNIWIEDPFTDFGVSVNGSAGLRFGSFQVKVSPLSPYAGIGYYKNSNSQLNRLYITHGSSPSNSTLGINILPTGYTGIGTLSPDTFLEIDAGSGSLIPTGDSGLRLTQLTSSHNPTKGAMPIGVDATGKVVRVDIEGGSSSGGWLTTGNLGTNDSTNFLGTTDGEALVIKTDDEERLRITTTGRLQFHGFNSYPTWQHNLYIGGGNDVPVNNPTGEGWPEGNNYGNTVVGMGAFTQNETGYDNTALGGNALSLNTDGAGNTAIGVNAMRVSDSGLGNVAIGVNALSLSNGATRNIAIGNLALSRADNNIGNPSIYVSGESNVAVGHSTLSYIVGGDYNVALGSEALNKIAGGIGNIGIGYQAGNIATAGDENIFIGYGVQAPISGTESNQLNIGNWIYGHNGQIAIGEFDDLGEAFEQSADFMLIVRQGIRTERVRVDLASVNDWSDYVFNSEYNLMPIEQLEDYILKNKHLPNIPSAAEVLKDGIDLGQMDAKLLEKIEELTLYNIELYKDNKTLQEQNKEQEALLNELLKRVEQLESVSK